ncbi:MAG: hypothetical protein MJY89_08365 [Bacteroidales bacterium]|nr:hypothetical protein [Bacteroidales bacterium]
MEAICIISAIKNKSYHLGFGSGDIKLSNVAYANANRDYRIFEEFAYYMINLAPVVCYDVAGDIAFFQVGPASPLRCTLRAEPCCIVR